MARFYCLRSKKCLAALVAGLLLVIVLCTLPVNASTSTSTQASVEVLPSGNTSCGYEIVNLRSVIFPRQALHQADDIGAIMLRNGRIDIKLGKTVAAADTVSVWAANVGWPHSTMKVYLSADGKAWDYIANEKISALNFNKYDFSGDFGDVRYIRIIHSGGITILLLDAVCVKGG
jgi:hypothetical protein